MALNKVLTALMASIITLLAAPVYGQDSSEDEPSPAEGSTSTKPSPCPGEGQWKSDDFIELAPRWDRQYSLLTTGNYSKIQGEGLYIAGAYGWSSCSCKSMAAVTLRIGYWSGEGQIKSGGNTENGVGIFIPGVMFGQFLGKRLLVTESLGLLTSKNGPGGQFDLGATVIIGSWFGLRVGINTGFYRTGLEANGKGANMWGLGPMVELIFVPWGTYRKERYAY